MKIDLVLTDSGYNIRRELERQTSSYNLFSEDDIAELLAMCGDYLKLGGHAHIFCFSVQLSLCVKAVYASAKSVTFQCAEAKERIRDEALCDQEKQELAYARDECNFNCIPERKSIHNVNMVEQKVHF